jgi:hypothetical protein
MQDGGAEPLLSSPQALMACGLRVMCPWVLLPAEDGLATSTITTQCMAHLLLLWKKLRSPGRAMKEDHARIPKQGN